MIIDCQLITAGAYSCEPTYGFWIQTGAIIISAIAAFVLVYYTQSVSKKRATIDLVMQQKSNQPLVDAEKYFYPNQKNGVSFTAFACTPSAAENTHILEILNNHEFAASGIRDGAFCEKTYKRMLYSVVVKDWEVLKAYVIEVRNRNHPTLFKEFEWLAERWKKKSLK